MRIMTKLKPLVLAIVAVVGIGLILWRTKPDWGGIEKCTELSGISNLDEFVEKQSPLMFWSFLESPRFEFLVPRNDFQRLL